MLRLLRRCVSTVRLDNIKVSCKSEKIAQQTCLVWVLFVCSVHSCLLWRQLFLHWFSKRIRVMRGEFEYVQSFTSHREFRFVDTLDESLDFIEASDRVQARRQRKQTWHYKVGWITDKEHGNAVADGVWIYEYKGFFHSDWRAESARSTTYHYFTKTRCLVTCLQTRHRCIQKRSTA